MSLRSSTHIAYAISALLFCLIITFFSQGLSTGKNLSYDEFYSLERSVGFEKHHDWLSVYSHNKRTAKKPPLHYWMNALCSNSGMPELLAFRLPSYLFLLGSIAMTAILCRYLCNKNPWALPAGILLTASSSELLYAGRSAMLDAGLYFFTICTLLGLLKARQDARWWYFCAVSIGLGALQKAPIGFVFAAVLLIVLNILKDKYYRFKTLLKIKPFKQSLWLTGALLTSWPLLQTFRYGQSYLDHAVRNEMLRRLSPVGGHDIVNTDPGQWLAWIWNDIHYTSIAALICLILLFTLNKLRNNNDLMALGVLAVLVSLSYSMATGQIYPRYLVALSPILIVITITVVSELISWKPTVLLLAGLVFLSETGSVKGTLACIYERDIYTRAKCMIAILDSHLSREDRVFIDRSFVPPGAYGYFGKNPQPYWSDWLNITSHFKGIRRKLSTRTEPVVGISSPELEPQIKSLVDGYSRLYIDDEVLIWKFKKPDNSDLLRGSNGNHPDAAKPESKEQQGPEDLSREQARHGHQSAVISA